MSDNPFAAPNSSDPAVSFLGSGEFHRDGSALVVADGTELPHRCIRCNRELMGDPSGRRVSKKIYYAPPAIYLLAVINVLILLLVFVIVRKPVNLTFSTCAEHQRQKTLFGLLAVASFFLMIASFVASAGDFPIMVVFGLIFVVTFIVGLVVSMRGPMARKHVKGQFWIHGLGKDFVNSIS